MADTPPTPPPPPPPAGALPWARAHLRLVGAGVGALVVVVVIIVIAAALSSSGGSPKIVPGSLVGTGPLTTGYRLTGTVKQRSAASLTVVITQVEAAGAEARNVELRPGARIEFDRPTDGPVSLARNRHLVSGADQIHVGDTVTVVGQFTSVTAGGPPHQGYAYIAVEASSG